MSSSNHLDRSRRGFMALVAGTACLTCLRPSYGAERIAASNPLAQSLGYTEDATKVDAAKYDSFKPGQNCKGCRFYQGVAGKPYGPCQIFSGKDVNANGWCLSFNAKT